jgi:hypothetical protein
MLRKKVRENFSKGWQLLSFPWSKRHLFQLVLTAVEAIQRGVPVTKREQGQLSLHKIL